MKLKDMGEFALIQHLTRNLRDYDSAVVLGIGDDAAAIRITDRKYILLTCDMLVDGSHFWRERITPEQLGHKALAVNLSDIAAMGGTPRYALISAGWPPNLELEYAEGIYQGMACLAAAHGVFIIGGDTVSAPQLILNVTVMGEMEEKPVSRRGAKIGHVFAVTGSIGASAAGLALLHKGICSGHYFPESSRQALLKSHLLPQPRVKEGAILLKTGRPSAMIDISDGLASEVHHLCEGSGVGAEIYLSRLPVHDDVKRAGDLLGEDYLNWALHGGEDYELLVTLSEGDAFAVQKELRQLSVDFSIIGKVVDQKNGVKLFQNEGKAINLAKKGYDHFSHTPD